MANRFPETSRADADKTSAERIKRISEGDTQIVDGRTPHFVGSLLNEMRTRWEHGERPLCDDYLQLIAPGVLTEQIAVDLIYSEFGLRNAYGMPATPASFLARFPQYREPLQRQFDLDFALDPGSLRPKTEDDLNASDHPLLVNRPFPISLGRYLAVAMVDSGGQAEVLLGIHPTLRKNVILKLGRRPVAAISNSEELVQEGRILASLDHENLVQVYDVELIDGYPLVVMDYVSGRSLEQAFRHQRPTVQEALALTGSLTKAVAYIHRQHLLHLDIKPRNIIIDTNGRPRLIDFGLARLDDIWNRNRAGDQVSGTLQYMAPEQLTGERDQIGPPADLFALGGVLHFLLTGKPPYSGTNMQSLIEQVQKGDWDSSQLEQANVPARVQKLCRRALAFDPSQRFATGEEMAREIDAIIKPRRTNYYVAAILLLVPLLGWLLRSMTTPALAPPAALLSTTATPVGVPELQLNLWKNDRLEEIADHLPLTTGDELRVRLKLPAGQQGVLLACDPHTGWSVLQEWKAKERDQILFFPNHDATIPLVGEAGTHLLLFCTAPDTGRISEYLRNLPLNERLLAPMGHLNLVMITPEGSRLESFGKGFGIPVQRPTAESEILNETQTLRQIVSERSGTMAGVIFWKK